MNPFWKPPAALIVLGNFALLVLGGGYVATQVLGLVPPGDLAKAIFLWVWGGGVAISDVLYRRLNGVSMFSLRVSTFFLVFPSWCVGVAILVYGTHVWKGL